MDCGYRVEWVRRSWIFWRGNWWVGFLYSDGRFDLIKEFKTFEEAKCAEERMARV
jgi:hypothetical protein